jgi:cell division protein FtsL
MGRTEPSRRSARRPDAPHPPARRRIGIWVLIMVIFIAELFGYTWCRVQGIQIGYAIVAARHYNQKLTTLERNLTTEDARLRSPQRIETLAHGMGLQIPAIDQMVQLP